MRKRKWIIPVLTVLVRGKAEEQVLIGCKGPGYTGASQNVFNLCKVSNDTGACTFLCSAIGQS